LFDVKQIGKLLLNATRLADILWQNAQQKPSKNSPEHLYLTMADWHMQITGVCEIH
tara:strand:- start:4632 stop:4799 length:168 start_codon:yes stop_codon:yes gene_type:complete